MYAKNCIECASGFEHMNPRANVCGEVCRRARSARQTAESQARRPKVTLTYDVSQVSVVGLCSCGWRTLQFTEHTARRAGEHHRRELHAPVKRSSNGTED